MTLLQPGDQFPRIVLNVGDRHLALPDEAAGQYAVVLFYRGAWCPHCDSQLRAFDRVQEALARGGIRVYALSADDEPTTRELVAKARLTFPVGFGADVEAVSRATGAFTNPDPLFLQPTGFVLDPVGRVLVSVYSSGAIGRLVPEDVIPLIAYIRSQNTTHSA